MSKRRKTLKRFVVLVLGVILVLVAVVLVRAFAVDTVAVEVPPAPDLPAVDAGPAAERLAGAIRIPTISAMEAEQTDVQTFVALRDYLEEQFPSVHHRLQLEVVNDLSLLFTWAGTDSTLAPVLLMAHMDVVPVEPGTESTWTHPPFAGEIGDGYVWGRGALDDKLGVLGLMEAVERLTASGFVPRRTVFLAFGHDEEVGGEAGAAAIAEVLKGRGVELLLVLDEGGVLVEGTIPGVEPPVALVGIAEKGYASFALSVEVEGGHSSMPPPHTAVGILAQAVRRLEDSPMPARLTDPIRTMLAGLAPVVPFSRRIALANLWLFEGTIIRLLESRPDSSASLRTTTAVTMFDAGTKDNVLPSRARAVVNFRLLPGDSVEDVEQHIADTIDDSRISIEKVGYPHPASTVSPVEGEGYAIVQKSIRQAFPEAVLAPYLVVGGTDARHYEGLSAGTYRFLPVRVRGGDRDRVHGTDERMGVEAYAEAIRFYMTLIHNAAG